LPMVKHVDMTTTDIAKHIVCTKSRAHSA